MRCRRWSLTALVAIATFASFIALHRTSWTPHNNTAISGKPLTVNFERHLACPALPWTEEFATLGIDMMEPDADEDLVFITCRRKTSCAGWGDRLRGIIASMSYSLLMRKPLMLYIRHPTSMEMTLWPRAYKWNTTDPMKEVLRIKPDLPFPMKPALDAMTSDRRVGIHIEREVAKRLKKLKDRDYNFTLSRIDRCKASVDYHNDITSFDKTVSARLYYYPWMHHVHERLKMETNILRRGEMMAKSREYFARQWSNASSAFDDWMKSETFVASHFGCTFHYLFQVAPPMQLVFAEGLTDLLTQVGFMKEGDGSYVDNERLAQFFAQRFGNPLQPRATMQELVDSVVMRKSNETDGGDEEMLPVIGGIHIRTLWKENHAFAARLSENEVRALTQCAITFTRSIAGDRPYKLLIASDQKLAKDIANHVAGKAAVNLGISDSAVHVRLAADDAIDASQAATDTNTGFLDLLMLSFTDAFTYSSLSGFAAVSAGVGLLRNRSLTCERRHDESLKCEFGGIKVLPPCLDLPSIVACNRGAVN